jgi:histone H3/H4
MKKMSDYISWSPIRRLMKHNGALIVARDAVDELVDWMGTSAEIITKSALVLTKHGKRKKITRNDILLAIKYFK